MIRLPKAKIAASYSRLAISGKRLTVRPYRLSDFKKIRRAQAARQPSRDKFDEPLRTGGSPDLKKFKKQLERFRRLGRKRRDFVFGIFDKRTDEHVGEIVLNIISPQLRWANIGYHIYNQHYGNGYASEAGRLTLTLAFRKLKFHRVEAAMEIDHKASQKVAERMGLVFEGLRRKFFPMNGGIDMNAYAANAIDFAKSRK